MEQHCAVERVSYIGVSEVPTFYLLCSKDHTWSAGLLDKDDHLTSRFGPYLKRGDAIWYVEARIDGRDEPREGRETN